MSAFSTPGFFPVQTVLGAPQLTESVKARASSTPRQIPKSFYDSRPGDSVIRDTGQFRRRFGTQQNAPIVGYGEAAKSSQQVATQMVPVKCIHSFEKLEIKLTDYVGLLKASSTGADLEIDAAGIEYIGEQLAEFQQKFATLRNTATALSLAQDAIYVSPTGGIQTTSAGSAFTVQSGVLPTHQGQLNGIISKSWNDPNADIPAMIRLLMRQGAEDFAGDGPNLEYAFYGKNVPSYLFNNTNLQSYLKFNETQNIGYIANGKIPDDKLLGLKWIDCSTMFYRTSPASTAFNASALATNTNSSGLIAPGDGPAQPIWGDDEVVFTPDPAKVRWWKTIEGHYPVPQDMYAVSSNPLAALSNIKLTRGMFAYAGATVNPLGIDIYMGDTFIPFIAAVNAIYQATVVPSGC